MMYLVYVSDVQAVIKSWRTDTSALNGCQYTPGTEFMNEYVVFLDEEYFLAGKVILFYMHDTRSFCCIKMSKRYLNSASVVSIDNVMHLFIWIPLQRL
jgi:hypothetical protein